MLTIFRSHLRSCPQRKHGRAYRRCKCPIWIEGTIEGKRIKRQTLDTRNWERAQEIVRDSEAAGKLVNAAPVSVQEAQAKFTADSESRGLQKSTLKKYRVLFDQMREFAAVKGIRYVLQFDLDVCRQFRESWQDGPISATKKLERFRSFLRFCRDSGWITENYAEKLKKPLTPTLPTLPLSRDEVGSILKACRSAKETALILLLRHSGLRIEDAATLAVDRIENGKLFLYTAKTGTPVYVPLPPDALYSLTAVERKSRQYFFWTGEGKRTTQAGNMRRTLRKLFRRAEVPDAHPHRFRDTFAVELLLAGVPMERVSILLGHKSVKITERHYSPWVRARQEQLEADVAKSWALSNEASISRNHGKKPN